MKHCAKFFFPECEKTAKLPLNNANEYSHLSTQKPKHVSLFYYLFHKMAVDLEVTKLCSLRELGILLPLPWMGC